MDYDAMICSLYSELSQVAASRPEDWQTIALTQVIPGYFAPSQDPDGFLEWARYHPTWKLTYAECASEICAKPLEAAYYIACAIVADLIEESDA